MSSRRAASSRSRSGAGAGRRSALEEIRRLREGGDAGSDDVPSSRIAHYKPSEESVFKEVTEEEYENLVQQRRTALPFVENDDTALGYFDDGEETFFESDTEGGGKTGEEEYDDEDTAAGGKKRSAGALSSSYARRAKKMQRAKLSGGGEKKITNMFFSASAEQKTGGASGGGAAPGAARKSSRANAKRDIDLDSMLDDLTSNPTETRQSYARPVTYSSGSSFATGASSYGTYSAGNSERAQSTLGVSRRDPRARQLLDDDVPMDDDNNVATTSFDDDHSFEVDEPMDGVDEDDDSHVKSADNGDEEAEAEPQTDNRDAKQNEGEEEAKPAISKRELLLRKAREAKLQAKKVRPVPVQPQPAVNAPNLGNNNAEAAFLGNVPSNEVAEWWQAGDIGKMTNSFANAEIEAEAAAEAVATASTDSIQMFWMDAVEVRDRPGKIYLIGKMKTSATGGTNGGPVYKSCCVVVNNLERYMYLVPKLSEEEHGSEFLKDLPKEKQQEHWMAMHDEIRRLLIPSCISLKRDQDTFQTRLVKRDYAFELADMPRGKDHLYLKVKYPARYPVPPSHFCSRGGATYKRICGAFTRPLETFLLRRKLLGPGWIEIKNVARKVSENVSFCALEYETFDPKGISAMQGSGLAAPPLKVMSLGLKTLSNPTSGKHEVVALSAITESGVNTDGSSASRNSISHFTVIRPLDANACFPEQYVKEARADPRFSSEKGENLHVDVSERAMLSYFLNRVQLEDPDVIVGHNLHKYTLDLLLSRIDHFHLGGLWSKVTRLRRGRLTPMNVGEGWNEYRMDDMVNGRLFCDTYVSSKELLTSQSNYSLSYLVQSLLKKERMEVEMNDIPHILHGGPSNFVRFLRHTLDDAMFVLQLMHKLEVLPLSKQLANLCGYLWTRTLEANKRAERIEYLLLHEFSRSKHKFIVPEKFGNKKDAGDKGGRRRREASYAGGMVFAPKKGLYDNYVVLLDFNSLYPSIIREYNICFTTVERQLVDDSAGVTVSNAKATKQKKAKSKAVAVPNAQVEDGGGEDDDEVIEDQDEAPEHADESDIPPLPSSSAEDGILPMVIKRLLESRKQVKLQLKIETKAGNTEMMNRLDIRQKAIKLTANSMYGCLGFRFSRFYAKPIAALITSTGRQTLQRAKEVSEQECGYDVVYGDTDSIMVDSRSDSLEDAKRIGREIQMQCNKHFKLLELEVDYIFKAILLLNKKKYAALVVKERGGKEGGIVVEKEVKGLDMVRRDWCVISKTVGMEILDYILSGQSRDEVVESIHDYLTQVSERIRSGNEPIAQFVITKSLNKSPEQYPDRAKQYHVQVALALRAQGQPIGIGSHIPYVLCEQEEPGSGRRAYHPDEVARSAGKLTVDVAWYLESQIHPPVNRLCAHIEGTSSPQLAHCLGLDTSKFSHSASIYGDQAGDGDTIPSVLQLDADRFKACAPLEVSCNQCKHKNPFPGVYSSPDAEATGQPGSTAAAGYWRNGLSCVNPACKAEFWGFNKEGIYGNVGDDLQAVLSNRLHLATREATKKYYDGWVVCSDVTCKLRTQKQSLRGNGNICSAPGCRALVQMEFPDSALYTQLKYFASLFDIDRAQKKIQDQQTNGGGATGAKSAVVLPVLSERHRAILKALHDQAQRTVRQNDYNWVKPSIWETLFT